MVRLRPIQLENRNYNITTQLACYSPELAKDIFKTFEDFRLVQQIREEIELIKKNY